MKIVVLDGYTSNPGDLSWGEFEKLGDFTCYPRTEPNEVAKRIGDADCVLTNKTPISKEVLDTCPNIKYIGVLATGYNIVDTSYAKEKGIPVTNVPAYSTSSVAQLVFALLLEICHHVGHHSDKVSHGSWENSVDFCFWDYPLMELQNKTIGLIGYGSIGKETAKIANAFGMNVLAYKPSMNKGTDTENITSVSLDELYVKSDIISLHCPLFDNTKGMINKDSISKMKDGVIIINTSRGALIVDEDLKSALESGKVYSAAVDVLTEEPPRKGNPLIGAKNSIITPHIAWAPVEARVRLLDIAAKNMVAFINGSPINVVN